MTLAESIAKDFLLPVEYILKIGNSASYRYKMYAISKRNSKEKRIIFHPSKDLKLLQRWLLRNILEKLPVHRLVFSYTQGRNIALNATVHKRSKYLLRMDIKNFFPSITVSDIKKLIRDNNDLFSNWDKRDISLFCSLVCRHGCLTIGAPTSPALSNAICYNLDNELFIYCKEKNIFYSRYADDLFFSSNEKGILYAAEKDIGRIVDSLDYPQNLKVNENKTKHSSKRGKRQVTGITIGSDGDIHVGRHVKRKVRSMIHNFDKLSQPEKQYLYGIIPYCNSIEPGFIKVLEIKFGKERVDIARQIK